MDAEAEIRPVERERYRRSVAGIPGMIVALVSAPASKHSTVAATVSSERPKSSAFRMSWSPDGQEKA